MKYEIIKGSEKDFELAPEWATECVWSDKAGESFSYWLNPKENRMLAPWMNGSPDTWAGVYGYRNYIKAERRPLPETVVNQQLTTKWDGTGIAHLGQHVEYFWGEGMEWRKAEVVAHYEEWPLLKDIEDGLMVAELNNKMRPIRSAEEMTRDKAIKAMREALGHAAGLIEVSNIYRAIAAGKIPGVKLE